METSSEINTSTIINHIKAIASLSPHKEICGLIDSEGHIYNIKNVAKDPNDFVFDKQQYFNVKEQIKSLCNSVVCVYHSHLTGDARPSAEDIKGMKACNLPYLIVAGDKYSYTEP